MDHRAQQSIEIAQSGGALALDYFKRVGGLDVVNKGLQDFVTEADQNVETHVRKLIGDAFPDDGIVGEEHAPKPSTSGYTWVIDPIDGTANFINAIPAWCVVISIVKDDRTQIGVTFDPVHDELYHAVRGQGSTLNGVPLHCPANTAINHGSVALGYCSRSSKKNTTALLAEILAQDGVFHRNASGALSLAYVAAGRLIGFIEEHMNAWDCLAGQLIIAEAGGQIELQSADAMIAEGGRVVAGGKGVFDTLVKISGRSLRPSLHAIVQPAANCVGESIQVINRFYRIVAFRAWYLRPAALLLSCRRAKLARANWHEPVLFRPQAPLCLGAASMSAGTSTTLV